MTATSPTRHHLDWRAGGLAESAKGNADDDLLTTRQIAEWLGVSTQWCDIGRSKTKTGGYGPPSIKLSPRCVRYRRGDVVAWLKERAEVNCVRKVEA